MSTQSKFEQDADPRISVAFESMTREANGFYTLTSTICSAFLGGALVFSEKFLQDSPLWTKLFLMFGLVALTACLILLCWVRWCNVELLRKYLSVLRHDEGVEFGIVKQGATRSRHMTNTALLLLAAGLSCLAAFAVIRVLQIGT
jgi:hypothetical protein